MNKTLIPLGLFIIVFGVIILVVNIKSQNYVKTEAIVSTVEVAQEAYIDTDGNLVDATYNATIKYNVEGKEYTATLDNVSRYDIGEQITIYYNPQNPSQITQTISLILPIIIIVFGVLVLGGGVINLLKSRRIF